MTTPNDPRESRAVELEVEVSGTPEQVWDAIATGPGISVWFVPCEVEGRKGGAVTMQLGPGFDQTGTVTAWDPPRRFAFDSSPWKPSEQASERALGLELLVEARSGGSCVVRLVNSGFGPDADWDAQLDSSRAGWEACLRNLRLYLAHFAGERGAQVRAFGSTGGPTGRGWAELTAAVGLDAPAPGDRVRIAPGEPAADVPALAGTVEDVGDETLTLLLDEPAPGIGTVAAGGPGDPVYVVVAASLFGAAAPTVAARVHDAWQAWMDARFPFQAPATA